MARYTVQNNEGKKITFDWNDPNPPTDADMDKIFTEANKRVVPTSSPSRFDSTMGHIGRVWRNESTVPIPDLMGVPYSGKVIDTAGTLGLQGINAVGDLAGEALMAGMKPKIELAKMLLPEKAKESISQGLNNFVQNSAIGKAATGAVNWYDKLKQNDPDMAIQISNMVGAAQFIPAGSIAKKTVIPIAEKVAGSMLKPVTKYAFDTLPLKLYSSAAGIPTSKKWIKIMPGKEISRLQSAAEEGLRLKAYPSPYGKATAIQAEKEVRGLVDDVTKGLSLNKANITPISEIADKSVLDVIETSKASSATLKGNKYLDMLRKDLIGGKPEKLTPYEMNAIKRQLYKERKGGWELGQTKTGLFAQLKDEYNVAASHEIMTRLENMYPKLKKLNETDSARIALRETIENRIEKMIPKNIIKVGAKFGIGLRHWPLALWEVIMGFPNTKAAIAFALSSVNPKYSKGYYKNLKDEVAGDIMKMNAPKPKAPRSGISASASPFESQINLTPRNRVRGKIEIKNVDSIGSTFNKRTGYSSKKLKTDGIEGYQPQYY